MQGLIILTDKAGEQQQRVSFLKTSARLGETRRDLCAFTDKENKSNKSCGQGDVVSVLSQFNIPCVFNDVALCLTRLHLKFRVQSRNFF